MQLVNENSKFLLPTDTDFYVNSTDGAWIQLDKDGNNLKLEGEALRKKKFYAENPPTETGALGYDQTNGYHVLRIAGSAKIGTFVTKIKQLNEIDGNNFVFPLDSLHYDADNRTEDFLKKVTQAGMTEILKTITTDEKEVEILTKEASTWDQYIKVKMVPHNVASLPVWTYYGDEGSISGNIENKPYSEARKDGRYITSAIDFAGNERKDDSNENITFYKFEDGKYHEVTIQEKTPVYVLNASPTIGATTEDIQIAQKIKNLVLEELSKTTDILIFLDDEVPPKISAMPFQCYNSADWKAKRGSEDLTSIATKEYNEFCAKYTKNNLYKYSGAVPCIIYVKDENQTTWINLNKKVIAEFNEYFTNTDRVNTGTLFSSAFPAYAYNYARFKYADDITEETKDLDDRPKIQQELYGVNFETLKQYRLTIGDSTFCIPPTAINVVTQSTTERMPLIRARGSAAKSSRKLQKLLNIVLYFSDDSGINGVQKKFVLNNGEKIVYHMNGLRSLLAQFMFTPFVPIENNYINQVLKIEAVSFSNISISTVSGYPRLVQVDLQLREFEYRIFMPEIAESELKYSLSVEATNGKIPYKNMFSTVINWDLMRYYYQKCILLGDELSKLDFNSKDYNEKIFGHKALMPVNFKDCSMRFYIPKEEDLKKKLEIKLEAMRHPYGYIENFSDEEQKLAKALTPVYDQVNQVITSDEFKKALVDLNALLKDKKYEFTVTDTKISLTSKNKEAETAINTSITALTGVLSAKIKDITYGENKDRIFSGATEHLEIVIDAEGNSYLRIGIKYTVDESIISKDQNVETIKKAAGNSVDNFFNGNSSFIYVEANLGTTGYIKITEEGEKKVNNNIELGSNSKIIFNNSQFIFDTDNDEMKFLQFCASISDEKTTEQRVVRKKNLQEEFYSSVVFEEYTTDDLIVESFSASLGNNYSEITLSTYTGYATQYMGGQDTGIQVNFITHNPTTAARLNALTTISAETAKEYRLVLPVYPLKIDSQISRLIGIDEVTIESCQVTTVEGYPGVYRISMALVSVNRTIRNKEIMKKQSLDNYMKMTPAQLLKTQRNTFFLVNQILSQAELYPDLELPTLDELKAKGFPLMRHSAQTRKYPDPDFYFIYPAIKTSQIIREAVRATTKMNGMDMNLSSNSGQVVKIEDVNTNNMQETVEKALPEETERNRAIEAEEMSIITRATNDLKNDPLYKVVRKLEYNYFKDAEELRDMWFVASDITGTFLEKSIWDTFNSKEAVDAATIEALKAKKSDLEEKVNAYNIKKQEEIQELEQTGMISSKISAGETALYEKYLDELGKVKSVLGEKAIVYGDSNSSGKGINEKLYEYKEKMISAINKYLSVPISENLGKGSFADNYKISSEDNISIEAVIDYLKTVLSSVSMMEFIGKNIDANAVSSDILHALHYVYKNEKNILGEEENYQFVLSLAKAVSYARTEMKDIKREELLKEENGSYKKINVRTYRPNNFGIYGMQTYTKADYLKIKINHFKQDYSEGRDSGDYLSPRIDNILYNMSRNSFVLDDYYATQAADEELTVYYLSCILSPAYATIAFFRNMLFYFRELIIEEVLPSYTYEIAKEELEVQGYSVAAMKKVFGENTTEATLTAYRDMVTKNLNSIMRGKLFILATMTATDGSKQLLKLFKSRDYNALNAIIDTIKAGRRTNETAETTMQTLIGRMLSYMSSERKLDGMGERKFILPYEYGLRDELEELYDEAMKDPNRYIRDSYYDMVVNDARGRMLRAFPTFYMAFIDEGREIGLWKLHDNFYNTSAIMEMQITKSRKNPTDVVRVVMSNFFRTYTADDEDMNISFNTDFDQILEAFSAQWSDGYAVSQEEIRANTPDPIRMKIRPGARMHIRMGYGSDASSLPIMFNGYLSEISCGDMIELIGQSDGTEISQPIMDDMYADEVTTVDEINPLRFFNTRKTPKTIITKLFTSKGGIINRKLCENAEDWTRAYIAGDKIGTSYNRYGLVHFGSRDVNNIFKEGEICQNIFEGPTKEERASFFSDAEINKDEVSQLSFELFGKTIWESLHICRSICPDYIVGIAPFGFRSTIFFGKPHYYYAYDNFNLGNNEILEKRKPYQQYHIYDSTTDIIGNNIEASSAKIKTCAIGTYQIDATFNDVVTKRTEPIFVDREIYSEFQKTMTYDTKLYGRSNVPSMGICATAGGIAAAAIAAICGLSTFPLILAGAALGSLSGGFSRIINQLDEYIPSSWVDTHADNAALMTMSGLRDAMREMYQGELIVIGDPTIKPYDRIILNDTTEYMHGQVEVREIVQNFSCYEGYTTTIYPDCITGIDATADMKKAWSNTLIANAAVTACGATVGAGKMIKRIPDIFKTKEELEEAKQILSTGKVLATGGKVLKGIINFLPFNGPWAIPRVMLQVGSYCLANYISKQLRYSRCCTVLPLRKNEKVYTAGLDGSMGLVVGSPTENKEGVMRTWLANSIVRMDNSVFGLIMQFFLLPGLEDSGAINYSKQVLSDERYKNLTAEEKVRMSMGDAMAKTALARYEKAGYYNKYIPRVSPQYTDKKEFESSYDLIMIKGSDINSKDNESARKSLEKVESSGLKPYREIGFFKLYSKDVENPTAKITAVNLDIDGEQVQTEMVDIGIEETDGYAYTYPLLNKEAMGLLQRIVTKSYEKAIGENKILDKVHYHDNYGKTWIMLTTGLVLKSKTEYAASIEKVNEKTLKDACERSGHAFRIIAAEKCKDVVGQVLEELKKELTTTQQGITFQTMDYKKVHDSEKNVQATYRVWIYPKMRK